MVLLVSDGLQVDRVHEQALGGTSVQPAAEEVVVDVAVEVVASRFCDCADDAAEGSPILRLNSRRLNLNFLQNLKSSILPRVTVDQTIRRNAVYKELVFRAARAVHLNTTLDLPLVGGRSQ